MVQKMPNCNKGFLHFQSINVMNLSLLIEPGCVLTQRCAVRSFYVPKRIGTKLAVIVLMALTHIAPRLPMIARSFLSLHSQATRISPSCQSYASKRAFVWLVACVIDISVRNCNNPGRPARCEPRPNPFSLQWLIQPIPAQRRIRSALRI